MGSYSAIVRVLSGTAGFAPQASGGLAPGLRYLYGGWSFEKCKKSVRRGGSQHYLIGLTASTAVWAAEGWQKNDKDQWEYYEDDKLVKNRWVQDADGSWMYVNSSGVRVVEKSVAIQGSQYVFDAAGHLLTGGWVSLANDRKNPDEELKSSWYYAADDGKLITDGWHEVEGKLIYFDKAGKAYRKGLVTVDGKKYMIDEEHGKLGMTPGWFFVMYTDSKGNPYSYWYYAQADGSICAGDWYEIDGHTCYFNSSGVFMSNRWFDLD